ncbi:hypothetical protein FRZ03_20510 [Streptomyces misionensis]|uniref:Uncharacterized protein n=1 Tax=Streptomyces misionensis TaxID=67331 RepID=A0A5C6JLG2_9ACTN|nr:hypothetical protein FRZ03_20510 [Streptomyces misionensis]
MLSRRRWCAGRWPAGRWSFQLVLQAPRVVAGMLGYHAVHAEAVAAEAGSTWKKYAPGERGRRPHQETGDR